MNTFKGMGKNTLAASLTAIAMLAFVLLTTGCAMSPEQLQALGKGDKAACFHARCESTLCGGNWSTTTVGAAATDGKVPRIGERCEVEQPKALPK